MQRTSLRGPSLAAKGRADESHSETSDKSYGLVVTFVKTQDLDLCLCGWSDDPSDVCFLGITKKKSPTARCCDGLICWS